jgi:hypothetical protein
VKSGNIPKSHLSQRGQYISTVLNRFFQNVELPIIKKKRRRKEEEKKKKKKF